MILPVTPIHGLEKLEIGDKITVHAKEHNFEVNSHYELVPVPQGAGFFALKFYPAFGVDPFVMDSPYTKADVNHMYKIMDEYRYTPSEEGDRDDDI